MGLHLNNGGLEASAFQAGAQRGVPKTPKSKVAGAVKVRFLFGTAIDDRIGETGTILRASEAFRRSNPQSKMNFID